MRKRLLAAAVSLFGCGVAGLVSCTDLFHATDFARGESPTVDFCTWEPLVARDTARRACVLLGACMGPIEENAIGSCLLTATQIYDCQENRGVALRAGKRKEFWECLARASGCQEVERCVFPEGTQACAGGGALCVSGSANDVYATCPADGGTAPIASPCAAFGKLCGPATGCTGGSSQPCSEQDRCDGLRIHRCPSTGPLDNGYDCSEIGAGTCVTASLAVGGGASCVPNAEACTERRTIVCEGSVAHACQIGVRDDVNCASFDPSMNCHPGPLPEAGPIRALMGCNAPVNAVKCVEHCEGGRRMIACVLGNPISIDCVERGYARCDEMNGAPRCVK